MKLNVDCTRAILLAVEAECDMEHHFSSLEDMGKIKGNYTASEIDYHARQCHLAGLFYGYQQYLNGNWIVTDLSPSGHNFLANIREDTVWNGVKSVATKVGSKSLDAIVQIASNVVTELIKAQFGLSATP